MSDAKSETLQKSGLVDWPVFSELVAMDEDEEGFSKGLFQTFVDQFEDTFKEIDENVQQENLDKLLSLGHYLKGSAAALGLTSIAEQCERIQNYGHRHNFDNVKLPPSQAGSAAGDDETSEAFWIRLIEDAMHEAQDGFLKSKKALDEYFDDDL
ncbi:histidine-phosphotransfer domain, HPT domain-containing protein [Metschnikowia bicuspidata var. bicuspidata NRRL YB-4993]|uniref:Histidine-phosphotransfer domain, HPT domain-containing protein n=1 Tax=Metschnikowia bicuspidata var. bicuspidata NRRL YB-4993 TaxID=869754 RepID=A0A1A0HG98_9ASCO|nr:histidine-phosphotransfer domain, HPT domain-containing protein [Metschnikowia bicuspidata var. bicuspidata NRRL YB-4993]OBA23189.1 histidine-phosphotransfer domain, HPT domain-containing protein [Metschnikowia bicuspidata var. bicuspidata NRRL YB-4993]